MPPEKTPSREIYFEPVAVGRTVKVSAVDAGTGTEASITGPASAGQRQLEDVALRKLVYVMSRNR